MLEGWKEQKLGELGVASIGLTYSPDQVTDETGTIVLRSSNIRGTNISLKDNVYVSCEVPESSLVRDGDILICVRNGSRSLIGKSAIIGTNECGYAYGAFMAVFRSPYNHFIFHLLQSESFKRQVHESLGATINQITNKNLRSFKFQFPPLLEQHRIAEILSTWDEAITANKATIRLREHQYLGLRDNLINWFSSNLTALKELVKSTPRKVPKPNERYRALSIRSHGKGTFERWVADPATVAMEHLFVAKAGDLIVNITFAWEGAVALVPAEHDGGLVSHRFPTYEPRMDKVNPRFLRHTLRMPRFTYLLGVVSPGGAGRNRVLNKTDFLELKIPKPDLDAQDRIAKILDDAEEAIAIENRNLATLQRQKRGLMQKLLTGELRVEVDSSKSTIAEKETANG